MFNPANIQSNIYNDTIHNFSILPPDGWAVVSQTNGTNDALVTFSNQNPQSLANFGIYYSHVIPIPQPIIALPNDKILNQLTAKLFDASQFTIIQKNIERFSDGFVIQVISEPKQNTQSTPISEWFLFWLDDGRQYYLILTSSQNNFGQNQAAFERSAYTFYVGPEKVPTIPEFGPVAIIVFTIMISAILILSKARKFQL
jgi:predicted secreted protein with PEFG-CTERM motif